MKRLIYGITLLLATQPVCAGDMEAKAKEDFLYKNKKEFNPSIKNMEKALQPYFTGVSIQDLLNRTRFGEMAFVNKGMLDYDNKGINSLNGIGLVPNIQTIRVIDLRHNKLTTLPENLTSLAPGLQLLFLYGNPMSQETIAALQKQLPNIKLAD